MRLFLLISALLALSSAWAIDLERDVLDEEEIEQLDLNDPVLRDRKITIEGTFVKPGWTLTYEDRSGKAYRLQNTGPEGAFSIEVPAGGERTLRLRFRSFGPKGQIESESVEIRGIPKPPPAPLASTLPMPTP